MSKKSGASKDATGKLVRNLNRKARKHYSAEEKISIVLAGLRGAENIAALCRWERYSREPVLFLVERISLNRGNRLAGDTARQATSPEIKDLRSELAALLEVVAELTLENGLVTVINMCNIIPSYLRDVPLLSETQAVGIKGRF